MFQIKDCTLRNRYTIHVKIDIFFGAKFKLCCHWTLTIIYWRAAVPLRRGQLGGRMSSGSRCCRDGETASWQSQQLWIHWDQRSVSNNRDLPSGDDCYLCHRCTETWYGTSDDEQVSFGSRYITMLWFVRVGVWLWCEHVGPIYFHTTTLQSIGCTTVLIALW